MATKIKTESEENLTNALRLRLSAPFSPAERDAFYLLTAVEFQEYTARLDQMGR